MQLGADLELAWSHPAATAATCKRILRTALNELVVRKEGAVIDMILHWQSGDHTALHLKLRLNAAGRHHWPVPEDTMSPRSRAGPPDARSADRAASQSF